MGGGDLGGDMAEASSDMGETAPAWPKGLVPKV